MKVHEAIAKALAVRGAPLFGLIGDANLFMVDAYVRRFDGRYVSAASEAAATLMALGWAQVAGGVGMATVTHGPALTNALTALAEGVKARVPMVLLAGDTPVAARDHLQGIDQRALALATGAGFVQLRTPGTVEADLAEAFRVARRDWRPVVLNMPAEFMWQDAGPQAPASDYLAPAAFVPAEGDELDKAVGILAAARAPILLAGRGATGAAHRQAMLALAERIGAPLATTLRGRNLFRGEPFDLGIFGTLSTPPAMDAIGRADCVIAFGASLNQFTTGQGALLRGKRLVQVDAHGPEIGARRAPEAALLGDPAEVARLLIHWLDAAEIPASGFRSDELGASLSAWRPEPLGGPPPRAGAVDLRAALRALDAALPEDRVVVTDAGRFVGEAWRWFDVRHPRDFVYACGFGAIGLGLPEAIGAAVAAEGRTTVLVIGDGGFMLGGLGEFASAVRHGCDLVTILCNAEHVQFRDRDMDPGASLFDWPDFAPVAAALGGEGVTVRGPEDLAMASEAIRRRRGPLLIDLKIDPERVPPVPH